MPVFNAAPLAVQKSWALILSLVACATRFFMDSWSLLMILCTADDVIFSLQFCIEEDFSEIVPQLVDTVFADW